MKVRQVQTYNKGLFTSMSEFELKKRDNGKTTLGTGSFGSVQLAQSNDVFYAIKIIQGSNISTPYEQEGIEREIRVHMKSSFAHIVKLFDAFQENNNVYIVLEYVPNGNLYSYIQKKKKIDEKEACKYFVQTCKAIQYLHDNNVFHRDIKPENLLLDDKNNIKLCDFGWCAENIHQKRKTFCGTYEYMAPEIVTETAYDYSIDIWSLGVLLYEMLHGHAPFKGKEYKEIASNIKKGEIKYSSSIAQDAEELIASILVKEPSKRPSINTILSSSFVTRNHSIMNFLKEQNTLKLSEFTSPRISSQADIQKYQSPVGMIKSHARPHQNLENSIKKVSIGGVEDVRKKISFETTPLKEVSSTYLNSSRKKASLGLFTNSTKAKTLTNCKSRSGQYIDENEINYKNSNQYKSICANDEKFPLKNYETERIFTSDKENEFDKILKMYMKLCTEKR